jgi:2-methylisocitrate lyase-like PEP mutase family enzyme
VQPDRPTVFRRLHERDGLFLMPNAWDVGSARLLAELGFEALATTSQGYAWTLGKKDQTVTRDELVVHVAAVAAATPLPLNVDSERLYPDEPGGVAETVRLLAEAGAAGCSIEDYDPARGRLDVVGVATERVAAAAQAKGDLVLTARCESHLYGGGDLDDTVARLAAYRDAGADVVYAPGLVDASHIERVVDEVGVPVNVLALPAAPPIAELASLGVRRVSVGSLLASASYGALVAGARELLEAGTSGYAEGRLPRELVDRAFG